MRTSPASDLVQRLVELFQRLIERFGVTTRVKDKSRCKPIVLLFLSVFVWRVASATSLLMASLWRTTWHGIFYLNRICVKIFSLLFKMSAGEWRVFFWHFSIFKSVRNQRRHFEILFIRVETRIKNHHWYSYKSSLHFQGSWPQVVGLEQPQGQAIGPLNLRPVKCKRFGISSHSKKNLILIFDCLHIYHTKHYLR